MQLHGHNRAREEEVDQRLHDNEVWTQGNEGNEPIIGTVRTTSSRQRCQGGSCGYAYAPVKERKDVDDDDHDEVCND
jgi:hypothetical protein